MLPEVICHRDKFKMWKWTLDGEKKAKSGLGGPRTFAAPNRGPDSHERFDKRGLFLLAEESKRRESCRRVVSAVLLPSESVNFRQHFSACT